MDATEESDAISRVLPVGEEPRLYRSQAIVAMMDHPQYDWDRATLKMKRSPVGVYNDDFKRIGSASLRLVNDRLVADISIDYATPERAAAETGSAVYPRLCATITFSLEADGFLDLGRKPEVCDIEVHYVVLSPHRPTDSRLDRFGAPILMPPEES